MGKYRPCGYGTRFAPQKGGQLWHILHPESEAVHPGVYLDVYGPGGLPGIPHGRDETLQRPEVVYLRFETVGHHQRKTVRIGIQHHYRHGDTLLTQRHPFVGESHRKVVHPLFVEHVRHFEISVAVTRRFHHGHHLHPVAHQRTVVIEVVPHGVEVHLQHSRMAAAVELMQDADDPRVGVAAQQDGPARYAVLRTVTDKLLRRAVELTPRTERVAARRNTFADADEPSDTGTPDHGAHFAVKFPVGHGAEGNVRHDKYLLAAAGHSGQIVERHRQRIGVGIVHVCHDDGTGDSLPHAEPHGHGLQLGKLRNDRRGRHPHRIVKSGHERLVAAGHPVFPLLGKQTFVRQGIAQLRFGCFRPQCLLYQRLPPQ